MALKKEEDNSQRQYANCSGWEAAEDCGIPVWLLNYAWTGRAAEVGT